MSIARRDQREYRSPWPFDWRASDRGVTGRHAWGLSGDPDDSDKLRIRTRSGHLLEPEGDGADVEGVTLPEDFPRLTPDGLEMTRADSEYLLFDPWPWDPPTMIGDVGFTVLVRWIEKGTLRQSNQVGSLVNFGKHGARSSNEEGYEIVRDLSGNSIYRSVLILPTGRVQTASTAFTWGHIPADSDAVMLAGVQRDGGDFRAFLDLWADGVRADNAPFFSGPQTRDVPSDWSDDIGGINARTHGLEVGTNTFKRVAWDRGVHTGTDGLAHFGEYL